ncbi:hypothetical protein CARUB_v10027721mg [Capsella rubella]|uniref:Uncharacterized protein n=1 Tax=Capsella rubella TaxID=81985 RepID=R0EZX0_9BRAS|nr:hypothetical protein CARUB_v10027721mg [Capsella rubella]
MGAEGRTNLFGWLKVTHLKFIPPHHLQSVIRSVCNDFNLLYFYESFQDKSTVVIKSSERCISKILRVSRQEPNSCLKNSDQICSRVVKTNMCLVETIEESGITPPTLLPTQTDKPNTNNNNKLDYHSTQNNTKRK